MPQIKTAQLNMYAEDGQLRMLQLRYYFLRHITGFFGFLFAVKVGVVFQFLARSFIGRRHVELCASCFLVSFLSSHRRSGIDM